MNEDLVGEPEGGPPQLGPRAIDMTGQRWGWWTVIRYDGLSTAHKAMWWCRCDCGREASIPGSNLRNGMSTKCRWCSNQQTSANRKTREGDVPRGSRRSDILIEDVVQRWLFEGEAMLSIASSYDVDTRSIDLRIAKARQLWPDLPWAERKPRRSISPTAEWLRMVDGKRGEREVAGSIIRANPRFKH